MLLMQQIKLGKNVHHYPPAIAIFSKGKDKDQYPSKRKYTKKLKADNMEEEENLWVPLRHLEHFAPPKMRSTDGRSCALGLEL
jgi:hypothetical protein